ncbi:MAG TPA: DUF1080 domain-containing protein [Verrucomicrobiae bacterium]|jgi:hypothetical protein
MKRTLHLSFSALLLSIPLLMSHAASIEEGFKPLSNGKDLTGWDGNPKLWSVQDGVIVGKTGSDPETKITHNTFLVYTNEQFKNFELRCSFKIQGQGANSGIQYRSKVVERGPFGPIVAGYQADMETGKTYTGILYEERGRGILAQRGQKTVIKEVEEEKDGKKSRKTKVEVVGATGKSNEIQANIKPGDWNEYVVIANGNHLQQFINGMQTIDVVDEQPSKAAKSGILALQLHVAPPMTVEFKDMRIKELPFLYDKVQ